MSTTRGSQKLPSPLPAVPSVFAIKKLLVVISFIAVAVVITVLFFAISGPVYQASLGKESTTSIWPSPFQVDYKIDKRTDFCAVIEVTVKGKAAKLAVILTNPEGKSNVEIIESDQMIDNCQTVTLLMDECPQPGTYILSVKTFEPEKVVYKKELNFSLNQLTVEDVKFNLEPAKSWMGEFEGYKLEGIEIVLRKDGNLPIRFTDVSVAVNGNQCGAKSISSGYMMVSQKHTVKVSFYCLPTEKMEERDRRRGRLLPWTVALFNSGDRCLVKGKLFFNEKKDKSLDFEKELVVR